MAPKCDLDACSLKEDIGEIKENQKGMKNDQHERDVKQGKFEQKMDDYMKQGMKEHELLFARTRLIVKWPHLATAVFVLSAIIGIVWKLATAGGQ